MAAEVLGFFIIVGALIILIVRRDLWQGGKADEVEEAALKVRFEMEHSADEIIARMGTHIDHLEKLVAEADERAALLSRQIEELRSEKSAEPPPPADFSAELASSLQRGGEVMAGTAPSAEVRPVRVFSSQSAGVSAISSVSPAGAVRRPQPASRIAALEEALAEPIIDVSGEDFKANLIEAVARSSKRADESGEEDSPSRMSIDELSEGMAVPIMPDDAQDEEDDDVVAAKSIISHEADEPAPEEEISDEEDTGEESEEDDEEEFEEDDEDAENAENEEDYEDEGDGEDEEDEEGDGEEDIEDEDEEDEEENDEDEDIDGETQEDESDVAPDAPSSSEETAKAPADAEDSGGDEEPESDEPEGDVRTYRPQRQSSERVEKMLDEGTSLVKISREMRMGRGAIDLILEMRKSRESDAKAS